MTNKKQSSGNSLVVELLKFPTHVKKSNTKYWKVNNQSIYNGSINKFTRAKVIENMHQYVMGNLPKNVKFVKPVVIDIIIHTVINHGSIQRRSNKIRWKVPDKSYKPTWDEDNLTTIWTKVIRDCIVKSKILEDDNVSVVLGGYRGVEFVKDFDDRKIAITIREK